METSGIDHGLAHSEVAKLIRDKTGKKREYESHIHKGGTRTLRQPCYRTDIRKKKHEGGMHIDVGAKKFADCHGPRHNAQTLPARQRKNAHTIACPVSRPGQFSMSRLEPGKSTVAAVVKLA